MRDALFLLRHRNEFNLVDHRTNSRREQQKRGCVFSAEKVRLKELLKLINCFPQRRDDDLTKTSPLT